MRYKLVIILYILALIPMCGCAWENLPEGEVEEKKIIQVTMRLGGKMRSDLFYYIVFNLSGDPDKKPYSVFDGEDRGKNWTVYYMWGTPPFEPTGLYRGFGCKGISGNDLIDNFPDKEDFINELLPGTNVSGDSMTLRIDMTNLPLTSGYINLNMIVCNQAIDAQSKFEYEYDPYVFDSFYERGITMNLLGYETFWSEQQSENAQEEFPNEQEETAPPEADIINWRFQVISK